MLGMNYRLKTFLLIVCTAFHLYADEPASSYGLAPVTAEQLLTIEHQLHHVLKVNPNKVGKARIHAHLKSNGLDPIEITPAHTHEEEFVTHFGRPPQDVFEQALSDSNTPLPSAVDNSTRPSFPPIGDQKQIGSCVAWASTYYQASHEIGMVNGTNNKTGTAGLLSPKWTYNLLNNGIDGGLVVTNAYGLLSSNGAVPLNNFPYDNNYLAWDLNQQDWITALSYRTKKAQIISGLGGTDPQDLTLIKQTLNNGHVLTFATYIDSWVFTHIKNDPSSTSNPYYGQLAGAWMKGRSGGHCITIVGYDDNLWIDVNGNGVVDPGEKGAFLIANSWSSKWGNNGFVWISYDAFLAKSAVPNGPNTGRVPAGEALNSKVISVVPVAPNYSPSLIGKFTISQANRSQINVTVGVSSTSETTPSQTYSDYALKNHGGSHEFDGTKPSAPETATFAVDLTDLLNSASQGTDLRYYLILSDNAIGNPTTLVSFTLVDLVHNKHVDGTNLPVTCDNSTISTYVDYNFNPSISQDITLPNVSITSPQDSGIVKGVAEFTVSASSSLGIQQVDLYIDSNLVGSDLHAPYLFYIDTDGLTNGNHQVSAIATDAFGTTSEDSISVVVNNQGLNSSVSINAGGGNVSFQGKDWIPDQWYSLPSNTLSSTYALGNPVYQTGRTGTFSYAIPMVNGTYDVRLKFAEIKYSAQNQRVFNVVINGNQVISNLDLVAVAGFSKGYDQVIPVTVTNNLLKIDFVSVVDEAVVSGIKITPSAGG